MMFSKTQRDKKEDDKKANQPSTSRNVPTSSTKQSNQPSTSRNEPSKSTKQSNQPSTSRNVPSKSTKQSNQPSKSSKSRPTVSKQLNQRLESVCTESASDSVASKKLPMIGGAFPTNVTVRKKRMNVPPKSKLPENIETVSFDITQVDVFGKKSDQLTKNDLCLFLPRDCCPFCYRRFIEATDVTNKVQCNCCRRKICTNCLNHQKIELNIVVCDLCKERNKSMDSLVDSVWWSDQD